MILKEVIYFYFKGPFVWVGILLLVTEVFSYIDPINAFRDLLWQTEMFVPVFLITFGYATYQSFLPLYAQRMIVLPNSEEERKLVVKSISIGMMLYLQSIIFIIGFVDLMTQQADIVPDFGAYNTWLGITFVMSYFFVPFWTGYIQHGKKISSWIQSNPHRPLVNQ